MKATAFGKRQRTFGRPGGFGKGQAGQSDSPASFDASALLDEPQEPVFDTPSTDLPPPPSPSGDIVDYLATLAEGRLRELLTADEVRMSSKAEITTRLSKFVAELAASAGLEPSPQESADIVTY